jgi:hypothetical protein
MGGTAQKMRAGNYLQGWPPQHLTRGQRHHKSLNASAHQHAIKHVQVPESMHLAQCRHTGTEHGTTQQHHLTCTNTIRQYAKAKENGTHPLPL